MRKKHKHKNIKEKEKGVPCSELAGHAEGAISQKTVHKPEGTTGAKEAKLREEYGVFALWGCQHKS